MFHSDSKTSQSAYKARSVLFSLAFLVLFLLAVTPVAVGQTPSDLDPPKAPKPATPRPRPRPTPRPVLDTAAKTPAAVTSDDFLELGYRFHDKEKWNAAEAAYKEALTVWPGNGAAMLALGYLYLDLRNLEPDKKVEKARAMQNKLRSVNSSYAATLLTEINKFQSQLAH